MVLLLPAMAPRSQFTSHNIYLWVCHIQAILTPRKLLDHLPNQAPPDIDPQYKRWTVEEEVLYTWLLDSMTTEAANHFIEYKTVKEIWDAARKYHSKKNDQGKTT